MKPDSEKSEEQVFAIGKEYITDTPNDEFKFICGVIETTMLINKSTYIGDITLGSILEDMQSLDLGKDEYKEQFVDLLEKLSK